MESYFYFILLAFDLFEGSRLYAFYILFIPAFLNFNQTWNLFAMQEDGVLCGGRFVPWKKINSYHFEPIDVHNRFYGYSPKVNVGYELWITTKYSEVSCVVTSEETKEKLTGILDDQISQP